MKTHLIFLTVIAAINASAAPLKIELPPETPKMKTAPGADLVMGQCIICHSTEYFTTQPPLAPAAWKAIVEKMQKKFGASLPAGQVDALVDYLAKSYGTAPPVAPAPVKAPPAPPAK